MIKIKKHTKIQLTTLIIIVFLIVRVIYIKYTISKDKETFYATYEGIVIDTGESAIFIDEQDKVFFLKGSLEQELRKVAPMYVVITGRVFESTNLLVSGTIFVETYDINEVYHRVTRILGIGYNFKEKFVVTGDNQVIYQVSPPFPMKIRENNKMVVQLYLKEWINEYTVRGLLAGPWIMYLDDTE